MKLFSDKVLSKSRASKNTRGPQVSNFKRFSFSVSKSSQKPLWSSKRRNPKNSLAIWKASLTFYFHKTKTKVINLLWRKALLQYFETKKKGQNEEPRVFEDATDALAVEASHKSHDYGLELLKNPNATLYKRRNPKISKVLKKNLTGCLSKP